MKPFSFFNKYDISDSIQKGIEDFHKESGYRIIHIDEEEKIVFFQPENNKPRYSIYKKIASAIMSLFY
jgi:hypothetical protein